MSIKFNSEDILEGIGELYVIASGIWSLSLGI